MAKSRFEYVRQYETADNIIPNTYMVVRVDGRGFHRFSDAHEFEKPNDVRALNLMDRAAQDVMREYKDVVMAFGESDEYSFLLRRDTKLYNRRRSKINSSIVSLFTSSYVFHSSQYLSSPLKYPPSFDSRVVVYPSCKEVRDYFSWRQADTHINNLYNTTFWALVKGGQSTTEANKTLQGTDSKDKNEILFSRFGINYNSLPEMYRKGSICVRIPPPSSSPSSSLQDSSSEAGPSTSQSSSDRQIPIEQDIPAPAESHTSANESALTNEIPVPVNPQIDNPRYGQIKASKTKLKSRSKSNQMIAYQGTEGEVIVLHQDIIGDEFWNERPWLLL